MSSTTTAFTTPSALRNHASLIPESNGNYEGSDIVWMIMASTLVFIMIPALSLIFTGASAKEFSMSLFRLPLITAALISFQWVLWGYALTFGEDSSLAWNWYGQDAGALALNNVFLRPIKSGDNVPDTGDTPAIPELVYALFEMMFAAFTSALVCGGVMKKTRPFRFLVFISFWMVLIYCPVARWSWHPDGWGSKWGVLDFAGGTPVHIVAGSTVAAFEVFYGLERRDWKDWKSFRDPNHRRNGTRLCMSLISPLDKCCQWAKSRSCISKRKELKPQNPEPGLDGEPPLITAEPYEPYNLTYFTLGTALLWFGWAGFNGGSALRGDVRAASAWFSTHVAASTGGFTAVVLSWIYKGVSEEKRTPEKKKQVKELTVIYFCDGAMAGLVAITPGAGYVRVPHAMVFGVVSAILVHGIKRKTSVLLQYDGFQMFAIHAGGGLIGMCLTGLLANSTTTGLDMHSTLPCENCTGKRFGLQLGEGLIGMVYSFGMTLGLLFLFKCVVFVMVFSRSGEWSSWRKITGFDQPEQFDDHFQPVAMFTWAPASSTNQQNSSMEEGQATQVNGD